MKFNTKSGFTLIELLVVVAIIGILASLVLASLNQARSRGVDAAIKGSMSSMRAQAELAYDGQGNYDGICPDDGGILSNLGADVEDKNGDDNDVICTASGQQWLVFSRLTTADGFCVDYTGFAGVIETQPTGTECNS